MNQQNYIVVGFAVLVAALSRIVPHPDNFTATESLALFGAAYLTRKQYAVILPVIMMFVTDFVINNTIARPYFSQESGLIWFSGYMIYGWLGIALTALAGTGILRRINVLSVGVASVSGVLIFFLVTNFGVWAGSQTVYPKNLGGLLTCYAAGIPFLKASLLSTLFFSTLLFTSFELAKKIIFKNAAVSAEK
jgi:hypothetical protein